MRESSARQNPRRPAHHDKQCPHGHSKPKPANRQTPLVPRGGRTLRRLGIVPIRTKQEGKTVRGCMVRPEVFKAIFQTYGLLEAVTTGDDTVHREVLENWKNALHTLMSLHDEVSHRQAASKNHRSGLPYELQYASNR